MAIDPAFSPPARAATLILVRQHAGELQTYLLRRSPASGFMPGVFVFPGGLVDPADRDDAFWKAHLDTTLPAFANRLGPGLGAADALGYAVAAVRETFEEAGVLFASKRGDVAADMQRAGERRFEQRLRPDWLRRWVASDGWRLLLSALSPWAHWITPEGMPRRFDTRFFVAALPEGQDGRPDLRETTEGRWISPREALTQNLDGRTPLSPPTLVTLHALLSYPSVSALREGLKDRGWGKAILPMLVPLGEGRGAIILEPWDPMHGRSAAPIDAAGLPQRVLPVGTPFSRLWNNGGIWKPVG